jgi:hypothetical protein
MRAGNKAKAIAMLAVATTSHPDNAEHAAAAFEC